MSQPPTAPAPVEPAVDDPPPATGLGASSRRWRIVLGVIAFAAAIVRLPGVLWGLPYELHPDEPVITQSALDLIRRNSLSPRVFDRPDHLEILLDSFAYRLYALLIGGKPAPVDFVGHHARYLAISRMLTVGFSIAAVLVAWCIGRRFGKLAAVFAAVLVAFFPPFIANSSYVTPDMPLTCMMFAAVLAAVRYLERPSTRRLFPVCAAIAVGFTIKYPAAIGLYALVVVLMVAVRSRDWRRGVRHVLLTPVFVVAVIFAVSHVLITDFSEVLFQLRNQRGANHLGAEALGYVGNLNYYATSFAQAAGVVLIAVAALGAVLCIRDRAAVAVPLLLGVVYWLGLSTVPAHFPRWALPMYISPLMFAAIGLGRATNWCTARWRDRQNASPRLRFTAVGALGLVTVVCLAQLFTGAAVSVAGFAATDTRVEAMPAFRARHITRADSVYDGYTPLGPNLAATVVRDVDLVNGKLVFKGKPHARYVVLSSAMFGRYYAKPRYKHEQAVYDAIRRQLPLLLSYSASKQPPLPSIWEFTAVPGNVAYLQGMARGSNTGPTLLVYSVTH